MKSTISSAKINGRLRIPSSKSYAQRALFAALLTEGTSRLRHVQLTDDVYHAMQAITALGADLRIQGDDLLVTGSDQPRSKMVYAGEAGLTGRILSAFLLKYPYEMALKGSPALSRRPFDPILDVYEDLGVIYRENMGRLPLHKIGLPEWQDIVIDGSLSSQFATGLLIVLPSVEFDYKLKIKDLKSAPYIDMTLDLLESFGVYWERSGEDVFSLSDNSRYRPAVYTVEADWSSAAFFIVAAAIGGDVVLEGLNPDSKQADRAILEVPGLDFNWRGSDLAVRHTDLEGFAFDATDCPDLIPALSVLAASANGPSHIKGVGRLRHKESDRAQALQENFERLGLRIEIEGDELIVYPGQATGGSIESYNDHRIVMAMSILATQAAGPVVIQNAECVSKSYPRFFEDLERLGGAVDSHLEDEFWK